MTTDQSPSPTWQIPALDEDNKLLGGVSAAFAGELGVDVFLIRIGWVVLFASGGWGALLYLVSWGILSWTSFKGLTASRPRIPKGRDARSRIAGVALCIAGLAGLLSQLPGPDEGALWSAGLMALGLLTTWRQFGTTLGPEDQRSILQMVGGLVVATIGAALLVFVLVGPSTLAAVFYLVIIVLVAVVLGSSPWWWRSLQRLDRERQAKAASDEREVVAAHLHDSVLQTLSLIQRNADDPQVMLNLARRQERELRNWLDPDRVSRLGGSVRGYLDDMASEIEELYGIPVEAVVVGDCFVDEVVEQALGAGREAVVNAAKHSGADQIDIYVEITNDDFEVYVRDRGVGFDPETITGDRRGIRQSIEARMLRIGGSVVIASTPGEGTEVELAVARTPADRDTK